MRKHKIAALSMAALMTATSISTAAFALDTAEQGVAELQETRGNEPFNVVADTKDIGLTELDGANTVVTTKGVKVEYDKEHKYTVVNFEASDEVKQYGYSTTKDSSKVTNWQESNKFADLVDGTYFFFGKKADGNVVEPIEMTVKAFDKIEVAPPTKKVYKMGEKLDLAGSTIKLLDSTNQVVEIIETKEVYLEYKTDVAGKQVVTVKVAGKTATFDIEVQGKVTGIKVKDVTTDYDRREKFDGKGFIVVTVDVGGKTETKEVKLEKGMLSNFDTDKVGRHEVKVTYEGCEDNYTIYVDQLDDEYEVEIYGKDYDLENELYYVEDGDDFKLPKYLKDSKYELVGFTDDKNWDGGKYFAPGEVVEIEDDTTFYMICTDGDREYAVYIDHDEDERDKEDEDEVYIVRKGRDYKFVNHDVPKGYKLVGFSKEKNGKGTIHEVGDTVEVKKDTTFYVVKEKADSNTGTSNNLAGNKTAGLDVNGNNYTLRDGVTVNTGVITQGYIYGYEDSTFRPNNAVRRDEFAAMLDRVFTIRAGSLSSSMFTDVKAPWAIESVNRMASAGIIRGYGDGTFRPGGNITKDEALMMLSRIVNVDSYKGDVNVAGSAESQRAIAGGIASGISVNSQNIHNPLTRVEAIKLINEIVYKDNNTAKFILFHDVNISNPDYSAIIKASTVK